MRIGVDVTAARMRAAVVDADSVVWTGRVDRPRSLTSGCRELLGLLDERMRAALEGATIAVAPSAADLALEGVGLLRISPAAADALGPLKGWPTALAARVAERTRVLHGGSNFLGTESVTPGDSDVRLAVEELRAAGADRVVVAAAGALADPSVERRVARVIREAAPEVPVTLAHLLGGMGLRERENSAVLEAALMPWAQGLAARLSESFGAIPVSVARGVGGRVLLDYFASHPFGAIDGRRRAAVEGAISLSGSDDLVVVFADEEEIVTVGVSGGRLGRPDVSHAWGVPHNHQPIEARTRSRSAGAAFSPDADAVDLLQHRPGHEVVVVGDARDRPVLDGGAFAVAIGAALAVVVVETERIVTAASDRLSSAIDAIVEETRSRAITAGADPALPGPVSIEAVPVSYVPDGTRSVRVRIGGRAA
jgi:hypothetical protein